MTQSSAASPTPYLPNGKNHPAAKNFVNKKQRFVHQNHHPPLAVTLIKPTTTIIYPFRDSSVTILDSIDNPLVVTLLIEYQGSPNTKHKHPVFLTPGEIFIQLDEDNDAYVDGPPLSHDFTAMLIQPMTHLSRRIAQLQTQLD
jgi:hypothetical protein